MVTGTTFLLLLLCKTIRSVWQQIHIFDLLVCQHYYSLVAQMSGTKREPLCSVQTWDLHLKSQMSEGCGIVCQQHSIWNEEHHFVGATKGDSFSHLCISQSSGTVQSGLLL
jgi:hypothetical protein